LGSRRKVLESFEKQQHEGMDRGPGARRKAIFSAIIEKGSHRGKKGEDPIEDIQK